MMVAKDFLELLETVTEAQNSTIMVLRTVGPDNATEVDKINYIYSVYKTNFESENVDIFEKFLYNEFTFVEFDTEEEAYDFAVFNFPVNKKLIDDNDFFVQVFVFSNGNLAYANDTLKGLSNRVGVEAPSQPVE